MNRLKQVRRTHKQTQQAVAEAVGIDRTTLTKIERGTASPSLKVAQALSSYFEVPVDWLFPNPNKGGEPQ